MRTKYILSAVIALSFFACQKEPDSDLLNPGNCSLEKILYYDSSGITGDTAVLVYTGNDVTRVNRKYFYIKLDYTNGKVSKRSLIAQGGTIAAYYDQFTYNGDGTIGKIESYFAGAGTPFMYYSYDYTYTGGKLTSILEKQDTSFAGQPVVNSYRYTFTYTGNNITKVDEEDLIDVGVTDSYTYTYDTKPNYYKKNANQFYYESIFLELYTPNLPFALSENNVKDVINSGGNATFTYTEENGNLKTFLVDGSKIAGYFYKCN